MGFHKIKDIDSLRLFNESIYKNFNFKYPLSFLIGSNVYGYLDNGRYIGGFILNKITDSIFDFRVISQIPEDKFYIVFDTMMKDFGLMRATKYNLVEFTGYFMEPDLNRNFLRSLLFTGRMILISLLKGKYFFFSYCKTNQRLEEYYNSGNPILLYEGRVFFEILNEKDKIEYVSNYEKVKYISRFGLIKIFFTRTLRKILIKRYIN